MNALLIVAHGSRRQASNDEIRELTAKVTELAATQFDLVGYAFLELADPSIPDSVKQLVSRGAQKVMVLPYFLARGAHVSSDIPDAVSAARTAHPDIEITTSRYLGEAEVLPSLLVQLAVNSR